MPCTVRFYDAKDAVVAEETRQLSSEWWSSNQICVTFMDECDAPDNASFAVVSMLTWSRWIEIHESDAKSLRGRPVRGPACSDLDYVLSDVP